MGTARFAAWLLLAASFMLSGCQQGGDGGGAPGGKPPEGPGGGFGSLITYAVEGEDARGAYTAEVVLWRAGKDGGLQAQRRVDREAGPVERYVGSGRKMGDRIHLRFHPVRQEPGGKKGAGPVPTPALPARAESVRASGRVGADGATVKVALTGRRDGEPLSGQETWRRQHRLEAPSARSRTVKVDPGQWNRLELPVGAAAGLVEVNVRRASVPFGVFLPEGRKPPKRPAVADNDRPLPLVGGAGDSARPDIQTALGGATWTHRFGPEETAEDWVFWWRDAALGGATDLDLRFRWLPEDWLPRLCDPYVSVDVSPEVVGMGDDIDIDVTARAFAGLDMFWWYGSDTGIAALDRAFIRSGAGSVSASHSWTTRIDQPGTYTIGANARDVLYPVPGEAHQASEGCGLAYDSVEVRRDLRKTYSVAFIILAPPGTDQSSAEFQAALDRVNGIKAELPDQFRRSTEGGGAVDVSYPTVVLTPSGQPYGTSDGWRMWEFVRGALVNELYAAHPDDFDFLAIYETFPDTSIGSRHLTVRTEVAGFGITPFDDSASWGSGGRLRGIGLITDATDLPDSYDFLDSKMHLLLHEVFGHQWGVKAPLLAKPGSHFDTGIQSPAFSVLYARPWRQMDPTNFTTADIQDPETGTHKVVFHPWMLYVAGMKERSEVPASFLDVDPDTPPSSRYDLVTTTGTADTLTLQEVINDSGDRYDVP